MHGEGLHPYVDAPASFIATVFATGGYMNACEMTIITQRTPNVAVVFSRTYLEIEGRRVSKRVKLANES